MDERETLMQAKAGNKSALNSLMTENYPLLKGYIIKMTGNPDIAQDILQETMLKAVLHINKFIPEAKFSTWLIKIATNVYRDYLRKNKMHEEIDETFESRSPGPEEISISMEEFKSIMSILMKMSYEKRAVFILKHYYGYKYEEIAAALDCPVGTVRSRLHSAVDIILNEMERRKMI